MRIKREDFLNDLHMVRAGLSSKELLEQSNCFVFKDGFVFTYNDEIACHKKTLMTLEGAVPAQRMLAALDKMKETELLEVRHNEDGQLAFQNLIYSKKHDKHFLGSEKFSFARDAEILLPVEKITEEIPKDNQWGKLPENFCSVINKVKDCASSNEAENWALTCVHIHPNWIEACNNLQLMRYHVTLGHKQSILVRAVAIKEIAGLGMTHISATPNWVHFKNGNGLIYSARKFVDPFPPGMDEVLVVKGRPISLPKTLEEAGDRAALWASDQIQGVEAVLNFKLFPAKPGAEKGSIRVEGRALAGDSYEKTLPCAYSGPPIEFMLTPTLLKHIIGNYKDCQITDRKLKATGGVPGKSGYWEYVSVLSRPKKHAVPVADPVTKAPKPKAPPAEYTPPPANEDDVPF